MSQEIVERVAQAYPLEGVRRFVQIGARVLHVTTQSRDLALKLFSRAEIDTARREAALLAHLAPPDPRYRVQTLVHTAAHEPVLEGDFGAVIVTVWQPGKAKSYDAIDGAQWHALGRSLGALHERLATFAPLPPRWTDRFAARKPAEERAALEALRPVVLAREPSRAAILDRYFDDQQTLFDSHIEGATRPPPVPDQAIHNDYNQFNYLFDGSMPPVILDWDRALAAPREYEVVRCLNHLPIVAPASATAFVDGYRTVLPLRRDALLWAIDAALIEHALKRWPVDHWLRDLLRSEAQLLSVASMVRILTSRTSELDAFFAAVGTDS